MLSDDITKTKRMTAPSATLYYVHDPMCSWCWGFMPVWQQVQQELADSVAVKYVLGGLARDSSEPMPDAMRASIRDNWRRIQQDIPGTEFNYDFWTDCQPRRSTYPACRAIIASAMQQADSPQRMLQAIQQAYYLQARNPSDDSVLIALAREIGLDPDVFARELNSESCNSRLKQELLLRRRLGVSSFPSLVMSYKNTLADIPIDYTNAENILRSLEQLLSDDNCL